MSGTDESLRGSAIVARRIRRHGRHSETDAKPQDNRDAWEVSMVTRMLTAASAALVLALATHGQTNAASINAGNHAVSSTQPFQIQAVAEFDTPWALAFLPDGRMLVTEKPGSIYLVTQSGQKQKIGNVRGLQLPDRMVFWTLYQRRISSDRRSSISAMSNQTRAESRLVLARAKLALSPGSANLDDLKIIWRQIPGGGGGQPGGIIAFDPKGDTLFLSVGDRMQPATAQDAKQARGKVLRLNLDGSTPQDNPNAAKGGIEGQTWTTGHATPTAWALRRTANCGCTKWDQRAATN